jgi:hypothetical protein
MSLYDSQRILLNEPLLGKIRTNNLYLPQHFNSNFSLWCPVCSFSTLLSPATSLHSFMWCFTNHFLSDHFVAVHCTALHCITLSFISQREKPSHTVILRCPTDHFVKNCNPSIVKTNFPLPHKMYFHSYIYSGIIFIINGRAYF